MSMRTRLVSAAVVGIVCGSVAGLGLWQARQALSTHAAAPATFPLALPVEFAPGAPTAPTLALAQPATSDTNEFTAEQKAKLLERAGQLVKDRAFATGVDFDTKWAQALDKHKDALDRASTQNAFANALNRVFREFGISHINIMTPRAAEQRNRAEMVGIGIRHTASDTIDDGLLIGEIIEGGPSERAGLRAGDTILKVDGQPLRDVSALRGEEGSKVTLTVRRAPRDAQPGPGRSDSPAPASTPAPATAPDPDRRGVDNPPATIPPRAPAAPAADADQGGLIEEIVVTRGKFATVEQAALVEIGDDAAVIRLPTFSTGYSRQRVEELFRKARDRKYLVIDLRSNGGGAVTNLNHFLGMLLPANTEYGTNISRAIADRYKEDHVDKPDGADDAVAIAQWTEQKARVRRNSLRDEKGEPIVFPGKVAVLINAGSASASEIFAAAMNELRNAPLVGTQSAGAVLVSTPVRMEGGFQMTVPISDYVTIKGRRLEKNPLVAGVQIGRGVRPARDLTRDAWVQRALETLREQAQEEPKKPE
jgi:carboxyl-terminal processing protease